MPISTYISKQEESRQNILSSIHEIIIKTDKNVTAEVGEMMGKEMILYKTKGIFKYGLASPKEHISLHLLPMYSLPEVHNKYSKLLSKAKFQKGCINFKNEDEMPLKIVKELIADCAKIDMVALMEKYKKKKV
jgi:hypothetical protein